jgi:hypothetical protein
VKASMECIHLHASKYNEMICNIGNKMFMTANFKEYISDKQRMLDTLKGGIPEERWNYCINYAPVLRNIEIGNDNSKKKPQQWDCICHSVAFIYATG